MNEKEKTQEQYDVENDIRNMNIYEKLSAITNELSAVAKNLEVGVGQSKYNAVGEADVLAAVKPLEYKYRIYSYPCGRRILESTIIENETYVVDYKTKEKEKVIKKTFFERIETDYCFVNIDKPEEKIKVTTYGDGIDSQDKSVGKAMTYADKYALLKAYKIITGEDPDQKASETMETKPQPPKFEQPKQEETKFEQPKQYKRITSEQIKIINEIAKANSKTDVWEWLRTKCKVAKSEDIPSNLAQQFIEQVEKKANANNQNSTN